MDDFYTSLPLQGCRIMITRPAQLADKLSELCVHQGAMVLHFPCMEIVDIAHSEANLNKIKRIDKYNLLIFISRNAVHYGIRILHKVGIRRIDIPVAAVGIKTAEALSDAGIANVIHPSDAASSEALATTRFIKNMKHGAVLIFRGQGGNPYLGKQLTRQGLEVDYAEVYRRQKPSTRLHLDTKNLLPDLITVASGETLTNLYRMTDKYSIPVLLDRQLVLGSANMKAMHNQLGFKRPPVIAQSPVDEDTFQAIMKHYNCR